MPVVGVNRDLLFEALEQKYTQEEFEDLCFEFGIELDDVTSEFEMYVNEHADRDDPAAVKKAEAEAKQLGKSTAVQYRIEVAANRYDILCLEGLARALRIFIGKEGVPQYDIQTPPPSQRLQMNVSADTARIRPFVVCAVLRGVTFTPVNYQSFIELQDKLHQNVCRRRTLVAIGTHDLDTIEGPFSYEALPPADIRFQPLNEEKEYTGVTLFDYYRKKDQCSVRPYLKIIDQSPVYPVIYDSKRRVLSLPPIINSEHSKITLQTRNVFIESTATDLTKAHVVLNTIVAMFSQYCSKRFSVEAVQVNYPDGSSALTPEMKSQTFETTPQYICRGIGVKLRPEEIVHMCQKMQLSCQYVQETDTLKVTAPPTRSDVLHPVDIMEDVAVSYGYTRIPVTQPTSQTVGREQPINQLSDLIRESVAEAGFTEVLTFILVSKEDNFKKLRHEERGAVVLSNPKTEMFTICRTTLLGGLLNAFSANRGAVRMPARMFELSDVVLLDPNTEVGARNERRLGALFSHPTSSGMEHIHGLVDRVMQLNEIPFIEDMKELQKIAELKGKGLPAKRAAAAKHQLKMISTTSRGRVYSYRISKDQVFLPGLGMDVLVNDEPVGTLGIVHPLVLKAFNILTPCAVAELNVETFL